MYLAYVQSLAKKKITVSDSQQLLEECLENFRKV